LAPVTERGSYYRPKDEGALPMCEGCRKIEEKIAHYREMASYVMDQPTLDGIGALVARLEEEKRVQHPKT